MEVVQLRLEPQEAGGAIAAVLRVASKPNVLDVAEHGSPDALEQRNTDSLGEFQETRYLTVHVQTPKPLQSSCARRAHYPSWRSPCRHSDREHPSSTVTKQRKQYHDVTDPLCARSISPREFEFEVEVDKKQTHRAGGSGAHRVRSCARDRPRGDPSTFGTRAMADSLINGSRVTSWEDVDGPLSKVKLKIEGKFSGRELTRNRSMIVKARLTSGMMSPEVEHPCTRLHHSLTSSSRLHQGKLCAQLAVSIA